MSEVKKYYYMKMKDSFFDSEEMKILESQKNGCEYQNLYLKMCLLSLKAEGKLIFKDALPYDCAMLSTVLRMNIDTVKTGIEMFQKLGLVEIVGTETIFMSDIQTLIGSSSTEADRVKLYRKRIKTEGKRTPKRVRMNNICTPEIELKIETKKETEQEEKPPTEVVPAGPQKELYHLIHSWFLEQQPGKKFKNYAKEGKAINQIIDDALSRFPGNEKQYIVLMLQCFLDLREKDKKFIGTFPLLPSSLNCSTVYERVLSYAGQRLEQEAQAVDIRSEEIPF